MSRLRILLADRHPFMLRALQRVLEREFEIVAAVQDLETLLASVERFHPDVVLVDLTLTPPPGPKVLHSSESGASGSKVIVLSVLEEPALARKTLAAGASGFVLKRCASSDLPAAIRGVASGETYVSPEIQPAGADGNSPAKD